MGLLRRFPTTQRDRTALVIGTSLLSALVGAALWLVWRVHDLPLESVAQPWLRGDALTALFMLVTGYTALVQWVVQRQRLGRLLLVAVLLLAAYSFTNLTWITAAYLAAMLLHIDQRQPTTRWLLLPAALVAAGLLWIGASAGVWRYTAPSAGIGLNSSAFGLLLLGTLGGGFIVPALRTPPPEQRAAWSLARLTLMSGWCYPLVRLYSLGPWNSGWLFATLLLGGALVVWSAAQALRTPSAAVWPWFAQLQRGLALVGIGLGSGAGLVLMGFALLIVPLFPLGLAGAHTAGARSRWTPWLLSCAVPFAAPFVATWMGIGAGAAGGLLLLAGVVWFAAVMQVLAMAQLVSGGERHGRSGYLATAAGLSIALGVGSPVVVRWLLAPVAQQLQGGLTPFGNLELWPWTGLLALDSARQPVAALPSVALLGLMLVVCAFGWLALRFLALVRSRGEH